MANSNLTNAKKAKNDEFYTQYNDIEKEINAYFDYNNQVFRNKTILLPCDDPEWSNFTKFFAQNFVKLGLKKLISTSFASESKSYKSDYQPSLFETASPQYDKTKTEKCGKIFTLTVDKTGDGKTDIEDFDWKYLKGDGDFKSEEIKKLRDEADIIITNPPFSLFREFLSWIVEADKKFVVVGSKNAITYKELFPLIKDNKMWVGTTSFSKDMLFISPEKIDPKEKPNSATRTIDGIVYLRSPSVWYSNLDHGRRHQALPLMSMEENLKYSKHKDLQGKTSYDKYDNYDAIEIPFTDSIPSDYEGVMGVPISFLDKYSPEQFDILGNGQTMADELGIKPVGQKFVDDYYAQGNKGQINAKWNNLVYRIGEKAIVPYQRILIKHKKKS